MASLMLTPPVEIPAPQLIPGFGIGVWLVGFVLLVGVLALRRRE